MRHTQLALEESRDRYLNLYEFAPLAYLTLDASGMIAGINLTGTALLGVERKKLLGYPFSHFVVVEDSELWYLHLARVLQQRKPLDCELRLLRHDGARIHVRMDIQSLSEEGARPELRMTLTDISRRKQAESAMHESEARFRTMADSAPVLIWMAGVDKGCTWLNQQWLNFTGRTLAEELGVGWMEGLHREDFERCLDVYNNAFDLREPFEIEYRLRRGDGKYRWLLDRGVPRFGIKRQFLGYDGSCVDITHMKLVEEDLKRAQRIGRIGSWSFDASTQQMEWSPETYRILGVANDVAPSHEAFLALVHPDDAKQVAAGWAAAQRGEPADIEHRLWVDDKLTWVSSKVEFQFGDDGKLLGVFGTTQDITDRRLAAGRLEEANWRLTTLAAEQTEHLRQLALDLTLAEQRERERLFDELHDHMQPSLVGARLMLSSLGARSRKADCLQVAADANTQIGEAIKVARTLGLQLNPPQIREGGLTAALESLIRWVHEHHQLEVTLVSAAAVEPADLALRLLCFRAVRELLMNVAKHGGPTQVTVTLQITDGKMLRIEVADSGTGFDQSVPTAGTGLATIRRRLQMLGGMLQIDSRAGQGTRVTLSAPLTADVKGEAMSGTRGPSGSSGKTGESDDQDTDRG